MHLLFLLLDFTIVFCFAKDGYVASFCNSPIFSAVYEFIACRNFPISLVE